MAEGPEKTTRRRPRGGARSGEARASSTARRSRATRQPTERVLVELDQMISALIKENRDLNRQIDRLSKQSTGTVSGNAERALRAIQRRVSRAVDNRAPATRRRSVAAAPASRTRRKITDPEVLERRRQALAKARQARAAKRANRS